MLLNIAIRREFERAAAGKDITKMLLDGELDAAIFGGEMPTDPR